MSAPGDLATPATTATPQGAEGNAARIARVKANIQKMFNQNATPDEIDGYVQSEGLTADQLRNSPVANFGQNTGAAASSYNPSFLKRAADLLRARMSGTSAPFLSDTASPALKAMDALDTFGQGVDVAAHGMTGGLTDEAAGLGAGVGAVLPGSANPANFSGAFKQGMTAENANIARFKEQNPTLGPTLEIGGLVASPLSRLGAEWQQAGPTVLSRTARAAGLGLGAGAFTGAAYNEGDWGDRAKAAAFGGLTGATIAGAAAPAIEGATAATGGFSAMVAANRAANLDARSHALKLLAQGVNRDNLTPVPPEGETLATAGGPNVRALARQATVAPGNARAAAENYFDAANAGRYDAIGAAARGNISGKDYLGTLESLTAKQRADAKPAYDLFYHVDPERFATPFFSNLIETPEGKDLLGKAYKIASLEKARGEIPTNPIQDLVDAEGNPTGRALTPRAVDYMKRALDQQVEANSNALTGKLTDMGREWDLLRRKFISEADTASTVNGVPLYQHARNAYAGPAALKEAMQLGRDAFGNAGGQLTGEKIAAFNALSSSEQEAARTGLAAAVIEKAGNMGPGTDPLQVFLKGQNSKDLIRAYLVDPQAYDNFVQTLAQESRKVQAQRFVVGGSPTSRIDAEKADGAIQNSLAAAHDLYRVAFGGPVEKVRGFANTVQRLRDKTANLQRGVNEPVANQLGSILFNPNAAENKTTLQEMYAATLAGATRPTTAGSRALDFSRALMGATIKRPELLAAPTGAAIGREMER